MCVGITQDRIDECRGAREKAMLADIQALVQSGADLNAKDDNGATLVRQRNTYCLNVWQHRGFNHICGRHYIKSIDLHLKIVF